GDLVFNPGDLCCAGGVGMFLLRLIAVDEDGPTIVLLLKSHWLFLLLAHNDRLCGGAKPPNRFENEVVGCLRQPAAECSTFGATKLAGMLPCSRLDNREVVVTGLGEVGIACQPHPDPHQRRLAKEIGTHGASSSLTTSTLA